MNWDIRVSGGPKPPELSSLKEFCARANNKIAKLGNISQVRSIGIDEETTGLILDFIRQGEKIGTFSLPWVMEKEGQTETASGTNIILSDYYGIPQLIVKLKKPFLKTFGTLGPQETALDGPPVRDIKVWKPLHFEYWNGLLDEYGKRCSDDMPVLVEPFKLIFDDMN